MVYDFEFRDGKREKEADIAADGTMLEHTLVITTKSVPKEAMKPIHDAAEGATMGRTEKISVSYEIKDGKVVKLAKPEIHYAVVLKKSEMSTEICVSADGKVLQAPKWEAPRAKKTSFKVRPIGGSLVDVPRDSTETNSISEFGVCF